MVFGSESNHFMDMNRIDGMPTDFEWKIFPGIRTLGLLEKIQSNERFTVCKPEDFTDRIIFMSMYNDLESGAKGNKERCEYNSLLAECTIQMTTIRSNVSRILWCASFSDVS